MDDYYVPGTEEKDPKKIILSLQQAQERVATLTDDLAALTAVVAGIVPPVAATKADQEAASSTATFVAPGLQQFHPSAMKAWVRFNASSGTPTIVSSYNVSSLTDNGAGDTTINFTTAFSSNLYSIMCWGDINTTANASARVVQILSPSPGSLRILTTNGATAAGEDWEFVNVWVVGDQ